MYTTTRFDDEIVEVLKNGGIGVGPTDTIYGILGLAQNKETVERIFAVRKRNPKKALIVLIDTVDRLADFGVSEPDAQRAQVYWPGPMTLVLHVQNAPQHLVRGGDSLAFRLPDNRALRKLIARTGPLVAPSANAEGDEPALSIAEAKKYFGNNVDFYVGNNQPVTAKASTILSLVEDTPKQLR